MSEKKKQDYDFFDEYFDKLANDDSNMINTTISEFGKEVRKSIDNSVKNSGYDSFSDMINHNINSAFKGEKGSKPYVARTRVNVNTNRFEYFMESLNNVVYENSYRGYYREGHQKAIDVYASKAQFCKQDLSRLEESIKDEIRRAGNVRDSSDRFAQGYLDGLQFVSKALLRSKMYMMSVIKERVERKY